MKLWNVLKTFSVGVAAVMLLVGMPAFPTAAEEPLALYIDEVNVDEEVVAEDKNVVVTVSVDGNENGFLAAEFGLNYDSRLTLVEVNNNFHPGERFVYYNNETTHIIWFSGANASASAGASSGESELFELTFTVPDSYVVGDQYYIGYSWTGASNSSSFWYTNKDTNAIDSLQVNSESGYIQIPDKSAPYISQEELQLNQNGTAQLEIFNYVGDSTWFSDNVDVCTVDNGLVSAVSPGTCTIYALAGSKLLSCDVTVTRGYHYSMSSLETVYLTDPNQLVILDYPSPMGMVTWISSAPSVVKVDGGVITGLKDGTAQIIASCNGVSYSKTVVVNYTGSQDTTEPQDETMLGDVSGDNDITIVDVISLNKYLLGDTSGLNDAQRAAGDVNGDGKLDPTDSLTILKYVVKLITEF